VFTVSRDVLRFSAPQKAMYDSTWGRLCMACAHVRPFRFMRPRDRALQRWFAKLVHDGAYDAIWIFGADLAVALGWRDRRRTILDGDNYDSVLDFSMLRSSPWYGSKVANYIDVAKMVVWERRLPGWFARVVRCSEMDRRRVPAPNVVVVPNGVEPVPGADRAPDESVLFIGPFTFAPNRVGMEWFVENIWPLVRERVPAAQLHVVGRDPPARLLARHQHAGVYIHGFVTDVQPLWRRARLSVVPLLAGSGTRLKILESLGNGVPCVSTTVGAFGLDLGETDGVLRADRPHDFAEKCVRLLQDTALGTILGASGKDAVTARYHWSRIHETIEAIVLDVTATAGELK
jgi:polysaccharide biosynthesis protein PslH